MGVPLNVAVAAGTSDAAADDDDDAYVVVVLAYVTPEVDGVDRTGTRTTLHPLGPHTWRST